MEGFKAERVLTKDGTYTIRHPQYDEEFHSKQGARYESYELYMVTSGFKDRLTHETAAMGILDVGLGLGYNALMTLETWMQGPGGCDISMISLEQTEALIEALADPKTAWKEGWSPEWLAWSGFLSKQGEGVWGAKLNHPVSGRTFLWTVFVGDACACPLPSGSLDFIWQDAFSPKKNPELWTTDWFRKLLLASRSGVCLVTYSVARLVKDNLAASGWDYSRVRAAGNKRQWLRASLPTKDSP